MQKMKVDKISKIEISENQTTFGQKYFWCCLKNNIGYRQTNTDLLLEEICVSWQRNSFIAWQDKKMGVPGLPDNSYGWHQAHCFNDYMERVIGTFLLSIRILVSIFLSSWPGEYGEELEKMRFDDESETDYLDCVKFCADLVWHGGLFRTSTNQF